MTMPTQPPHGQPGQPYPGGAMPARRPVVRKTSTVGPQVLTFSGVFALVLAVVALVVAGKLFIGLLPMGVLTSDGSPGSDVVSTVEAPGTAKANLEAFSDYALYVAVDGRGEDTKTALTGPITVTAPDGTRVAVSRSAEVDIHTSRGSVSAATVGSFHTTQAGAYTIEAPAAISGTGASVLVAPDTNFAPFLGGIFGTVFGFLAGAFLGIIGLGLTAGGAIWWYLRRKNRTQLRDAELAAGGTAA